MKKVNLGVIATVATAFALMAVAIVHLSQQMKDVNEIITALKNEECDMPY